MKKTSLSFRSLRAGSYLHRFFLSKKNNTVNHKNRSRSVMAAAVLAASLGISSMADAQCNTFLNADVANPLLSVIPAGKKITGLDFADIDGDGLTDCYVRFDSSVKLNLYHNIGSASHPVFIESKKTGFENTNLPHHSRVFAEANQYMQFVDIDGDGDLDFFITEQNQQYYGSAGIRYYENTGTNKVPDFRENEAKNPVAGFAYCYYYVPFKFADIDGDGDYDLYYNYDAQYGFNSIPYVYLNNGTKFLPHYVIYTYVICACAEEGRTYYDWNKDGLPDYFTVFDVSYDGGNSSTDLYKNTGPKEAPQYVDDNKDKPRFQNGVPYRMIDLNNDGAPEVFNATGHYSTLAPVVEIVAGTFSHGNRSVTILQSKTQSNDYVYRWEYNGKTIPGATDYKIQAKLAGTYTLYITDLCGTGVSLNYELKINGSSSSTDDSKMTGFANDVVRMGVKVYPNPFINTITLQLPGTVCTVKITDMAGRVLLTQNTSAATLQTGEKLKAGSYIVQVWQGKEMIYTTTIVKK